MKNLIALSVLFFLLASQMSAFQTDDLQKARQYLEENKPDLAKSILSKIIDNNDDNHEAFYLLGRANFALKQYDEAADNFEEAVELFDGSADYHFWLGQTYAVEVRDASIFRQAFLALDILDEFERTVELDPKHVPGRIGLVNYYTAAPGVMGGDINKALINAKELVKLDEKTGRLALAAIYLKKEKMDSVNIQINLLEDKFGNDKSTASIYNSLGYFYLNSNKIDEAVAAFEKQVELNPQSANAHDSLGDGYKAAGRFDDAIAQYKMALEINPDFTASANNLEELQENVKNK